MEGDSKSLDWSHKTIVFRPIGSAESVQAIQTPMSTWTAAQSADVQILLQQETQFDQPSNPHLLKVVQWLESRLKDNQKKTPVHWQSYICERSPGMLAGSTLIKRCPIKPSPLIFGS